MDAMDAILSRRSIRSYTSQPVPEDVVKELLEAGMSAPSAGNEQPWHFVVLTDRKILDEIPTFHPYSHMLGGAPLAILVCGDLNLQRYEGYWVQDCSAATQNILIAIQAKGLGAAKVGIGIIAADAGLKGFYASLGFAAGEIKTFEHLPFAVAFMSIAL